MPVRQDQETAVVDNPTQAARPLPWGPTDPLFPALEVQRGATEGQECDPLAVMLRDIAQGLAHQAGVGQVMLIEEGPVEGLAFVLPDQAHCDPGQNIRFVAVSR